MGDEKNRKAAIDLSIEKTGQAPTRFRGLSVLIPQDQDQSSTQYAILIVHHEQREDGFSLSLVATLDQLKEMNETLSDLV